MRLQDLRCQTDRPVPRHARGGTGRGRQYARRLSPRPHRFLRIPRPQPARTLPAPRPRRCGTTSPISTPAASNRRAWRAGCRRCGICFASCSTSGSAATIRPRSCPARSAAAACPRCCRSPDVDRLLVHAKDLTDAGRLGAATAARAAAVLPAGSALRHRLAGIRTGGAAAVGGAARRPHDRGARQGQQGTAGAAERGFAAGDGRLPRRDGSAEAGEEEERRRPRNGCFPRSARADI